MEYRALEMTLVSARDLKDVNLFTKMDVYAVVSISGDPRTMQRTPVHENAGKNPRWNYTMKLMIDGNLASQNRLNLVIQLRSRRSLGDREIGEVHVPIKELLDNPGDGSSPQNVIYKVRKPSGKAHGELSFSYKLGDKVTQAKTAEEPVTAYPAYPPPAGAYQPPPPGVGSSGGYPLPPAAYGAFPPPPVAGYGGYQPAGPPPPPQGGYGYGYGYGYGGYPQPPPPMQQQAPRKNNFGMGMGAGLLGGALGGMLIGDMMSDAAAYDAGFDDGGGFDF